MLCTAFGVVLALIGPLQLLTVGLVGWLAAGAYYYGHLQNQGLAFKISVGCILVLAMYYAFMKALWRHSFFQRVQVRCARLCRNGKVRLAFFLILGLLGELYEKDEGKVVLICGAIILVFQLIFLRGPRVAFGAQPELSTEFSVALQATQPVVDHWPAHGQFGPLQDEHWASYSRCPSLQGRTNMKEIHTACLQSIPASLRDRASSTIHQMLANESRSEGFVVFYHLYSHSSLLYELQTVLATELLDYSLEAAPLMRLSRKPFADVGSLKDILSIRERNMNDRSREYRALAVSCFSSCFATGGYTQGIQKFLLKGFPSGTAKHSNLLVEELLVSVGILADQPMQMKGLMKRIMASTSVPQGDLPGQVLQIFVHQSVVDAFVYGAQPLGKLAPQGMPVSEWLRQQCPLEGQVRLVPHPDLFLAGSLVKVFDFCPSQDLDKVAIRSALRDLLQPYLKRDVAKESLGYEEVEQRSFATADGLDSIV